MQSTFIIDRDRIGTGSRGVGGQNIAFLAIFIQIKAIVSVSKSLPNTMSRPGTKTRADGVFLIKFTAEEKRTILFVLL